MGRRHLRLVHTSDVHLGESAAHASAFGGAGGSSPGADEIAFVEVIDLAIAERADALLIAGDLFDSNRVGAAAVTLVETQLRRLRCPVLLIPGNHDCFDESSIYRRHDLRAVGEHVHVLTAESGEIVALRELDLVVWGKGLVDHHPGYRPMEGVPGRPGEHWFVGLAHGHFVEDRREPRSSLITPDEIAGSGLDYLALGHVHVFRDVSRGSTRACYPGAPRVAHRPEIGGAALVELDPVGGVTVEARVFRR